MRPSVTPATKAFTRRLACSGSEEKSTDSAVAAYLDAAVAMNSGSSSCPRSTHTPHAKDVYARPLSLPASSVASTPCSSSSDAEREEPQC